MTNEIKNYVWLRSYANFTEKIYGIKQPFFEKITPNMEPRLWNTFATDRVIFHIRGFTLLIINNRLHPSPTKKGAFWKASSKAIFPMGQETEGSFLLVNGL